MLKQCGQPMNVGIQAAEAVAGVMNCVGSDGARDSAVAIETEVEVIPGDLTSTSCTLQRFKGPSGMAETRMYSGIGHAFVRDAKHEMIKDTSNRNIVEHAADASIRWCQAFMCK
eukprot:TRINITY_DN7739_c1_g1_i1.p1 TRINITY_DN7739_c1_g1~~TRINITY_DN7739_c1_g1_i1.p1  ORF type:complete len:114 (+),score=13.74 TRINITY_DN7739_c1_g1_i1:90-431(+)